MCRTDALENTNRLIQHSAKEGSISFTIRVVPRASRSEIVGEIDAYLKVRIAAPPVGGAANDEVVKLLAKEFGVARSNVSIVSGERSKTKRVQIIGATSERLRSLAGGS